MSDNFNYKFGWIPDLPDIRDYTVKHEKLSPILSKISIPKVSSLPNSADLREWCSKVENQGNIGSCTAHAVTSIVEYYENKCFGKHLEASRLFLYKVSRNLLHSKGDTGAFLKTVLGALVLFGIPPEEYWPYDVEKYDLEPDSFCYAFGQNYRCISYFRHDPVSVSPKDVLTSVKKYLSTGIPSVFGFTVYSSIRQADLNGCIPFPGKGEKVLGGHAIAAVGYNDNQKIKNTSTGETTTGALLIKNSWGEEWGEKGFGWLPYEYVLQGLALDFWSILKQDWIDSDAFFEPKT